MRRFTLYLLPLALVLGLAACDSTEDDPAPDTELFIGTWEVAQVQADGEDQTAAFQEAGDLSMEFAPTEYTFDWAPTDGDPTQFAGTYTVNEAASQITLAATALGGNIDLVFDYSFDGEDELVLTPTPGAAVVIQLLLEDEALSGNIELTLVRQ